MQDPERYLKERKIRLTSALDASRPARIDPRYRAAVNHEIYYFADSAQMRRFLVNPIRWCGIVTDPVSRTRFRPNSRSPRLTYDGRPYFFQNRLDLETFSAMPDSFANRRGM